MFYHQIYKFNLRCLHLCGRSIYKQTQKIINNWRPDYLPLTILYSPKDVKLKVKNQSNITYITQKIDDKQLKMLMNTHSIHLCCSETEGFGHYINEAKSCQALILTTNAPPMSELIDDNNGVRINYAQEISLSETLGHKYELDDNHFHQIVSSLSNLPDEKICTKGR